MPDTLPDLSGCRIWLSRPAAQAGAWKRIFERSGASVMVEPLIDIVQPDHPEQVAARLAEMEHADIVIAASTNAVRSAAKLRPEWAPTGALIAVGRASADALARQTGRKVEMPRTADSEGLLALPELASPRGCSVAILAGHGGRRKLADTLRARGARVEKLALYRRRTIRIDGARLDELLAADIVVVTSMEAWLNLAAQLGSAQRARLSGCRLVVSGHRVVKQACREVDWQSAPVVIENMNARCAVAALDRAWKGRTH